MNALQHTEKHYFTLSKAMLHTPIEITTNHTELRVCTWPSGKKSFVPPSGTIELHARLEFTGQPFPVGTTVPISTIRFPCDPEGLGTPEGFEIFSIARSVFVDCISFQDIEYLKVPAASILTASGLNAGWQSFGLVVSPVILCSPATLGTVNYNICSLQLGEPHS